MSSPNEQNSALLGSQSDGSASPEEIGAPAPNGASLSSTSASDGQVHDDLLDPAEAQEIEALGAASSSEIVTVRTDEIELEDRDLIGTMEMPAFRMPTDSYLGNGDTDEHEAIKPSDTDDDSGRAVPLTGILRRSRRTLKNRNGTDQASSGESDMMLMPNELIPDIVVYQPPALSLSWSEGLPVSLLEARRARAEAKARAEAEARARAEAEARARAEAKARAEAEARARAEAKARAAQKPTSRPAAQQPGDASLVSQTRNADGELAFNPVASKPPPVPRPTPPSQATAPAAPAAPAKEDDDELYGLVQELLDESTPKSKVIEAPKPELPWYESIFNEEYFRTLPMGFHKQTVREAHFIIDQLGVGPGGRIIDLCCGFGRHTIELSKRGYDMSGLDLSLPLLQKALNEAQRRKLSIRFIHGDMRELNFNREFDALFNIHTSFGYFDDQTNFNILVGSFKALKPGGRMLLEVINRDSIMRQLPRRIWWEGTECIFVEEISFNDSTSTMRNKRSYLYDDGRPPWEQDIRIRLFSLHELLAMFRMAGFRILNVSGSIATPGYFLGADSPQIIILAERPA
ncbi:MAG: methyltransferase domain-containing protein [Myxococcota bacterium]